MCLYNKKYLHSNIGNFEINEDSAFFYIAIGDRNLKFKISNKLYPTFINSTIGIIKSFNKDHLIGA